MITIDRNININEARAAGPYFVHHGGEAGGGFYDIALEPQLSRWPDIAHAALIELKYLKPGAPQPTPEALAAIKAEAIDQLDRYCADPALRRKWQLGDCSQSSANGNCPQILNVHKSSLDTNINANGGASRPGEPGKMILPIDGTEDLRFVNNPASAGTVSLHRLVLVFKGGDCILHEEV